jgi:circadian clock protein KaiC
VVKLRGSEHSNELRLFNIDADGIRIGDMLAGREGLLGGRPSRAQSNDGAAMGREHD